MADEKIIGFTREELVELVRQILSEIPTSLPANGGNSDTVGNKTYDEIKNTSGTNILTSPDVSTDLRAWMYNFDSGIYVVAYNQTNLIFPDKIADGTSGVYHIIDWKRRYSNDMGGYPTYYGLLEIRSLTTTNAVYRCAVYNNTNYSPWWNVKDADTVGGKSSDKFALTNHIQAYTAGECTDYTSDEATMGITPAAVKKAFSLFTAKNATNAEQVTSLRHESAYTDIFSTSLTSTHSCWNKWCYVVGNSNDSSSSDYIANAPENSAALWYEVCTGGRVNRAFQIAIGCFKHQRSMFIRYQHDGTWSGWYTISSPLPSYVVGEFAISASQTKTISLGFTPSYVDVRGKDTGYQISVEAKITTNGFTAVALDSLSNNVVVKYIAFR